MAVKIRWTSGGTPEERKRTEWEHIIRFEVGEAVPDMDVTLELRNETCHWHVEAPEPLYRARIVQALRAAGKPAD
jgi:hypothetical protein